MSARGRHFRRTFHRERAVLRQHGCTCRPTIVREPRSTWEPGQVDVCTVTHEPSCPLGVAAQVAQALGREPGVFYEAPGGCER